MASTKTLRVSQAVYDRVKQDLREDEIVDDVLRRAFDLEGRTRNRRRVARRDLFLRIRNNYVTAGLSRARGGVRYQLPATTDDTEANAAVRDKVVGYAHRNDVSEVEIDGIARFFRQCGYFLRRRTGRQGEGWREDLKRR